ncbi:MAG: tetratricopeptide repeat protein [Limisphaerales bacterium]
MARALFPILFLACLALVTRLEPWFQSWQGNRAQSADLLAVLLGDARRAFANHFFIKADAYFHSGYYPSIFDNRTAFQTPHMAADAGAKEDKNSGEEDDFLGPPRDWIDAFGRRFKPATHTHLDEGGAHTQSQSAAPKEIELSESQDVREILPWLRASAALDPQKVETYTTTAYWLRQRLGTTTEAEAFLRDGLRANPDSYEILFELGRIADEHRKDPARARNLWELALAKWQKFELPKKDPDTFSLLQIASHLALLAERESRWDECLHYLGLWKAASPKPDEIEKRITEVRQKIPAANHAKPPAPNPKP